MLGFLVFWGGFGLHTVASGDFHAKIRALSFWLHKFKDGCYFLVVRESPIKLWPLKTFTVFTVEPCRGTDYIYGEAFSNWRIWLVFPDVFSVEYTNLNFWGSSHSCSLFHPSVSAPLSCVCQTLGHHNFHTWLIHRQQSAEAAEWQHEGLSAITALIPMHPYMRGHWYAHIYLCIHISNKTYSLFRYAHIL